MLTDTYNLTLPETINLAVANSAVHYFHVVQQAVVRAVAVAVNGTTISSGADVVVTFSIVGGAALGTVNLPTTTAAGAGVSSTVASVVLPAGSVVRAIVTTAATIAGGTGSCTLGLSNG